MIRTEGIDHVAFRVQDLEASVEWYGRILGLERRHGDVWDVPVMLGSGTTMIALFPKRDGGDAKPAAPMTGFRHLAFRVSRAEFEAAQAALDAEGIAFEFRDHDVAHSIYFSDPDGTQLEITTYELA